MKEKQITGKQRREATNKILRSTLRLLVLLRESLVVQQVPKTNPLNLSVYTHANLIGSLLPNDELISPAELAEIKLAARGESPAAVEDKPQTLSLTDRVRAAFGGKGQS